MSQLHQFSMWTSPGLLVGSGKRCPGKYEAKCAILSSKPQDIAQYLQSLGRHSSEMYYTQSCAQAGKQVVREHRFPDQKLRRSQVITEGLH